MLGLDSVLGFGKHKGETISRVIEDDPQYIRWAQCAIDWFELTPEADQAATRALSNALRDELSANRFAFRPNCGRARNQDHDEVPFSDLDFVGKGVW